MTDYKNRLQALRTKMKAQKLDGFIVPLTDAHMSEYVPDYAKRLSFLTGFTGSAGAAAISLDKAAVFIDGRYTIQAKNELDPALFDIHHFEEYPLLDWMADQISQGGLVGYDSSLATRLWEDEARAKLAVKAGKITALAHNLIDQIWHDQPTRPLDKAYAQPLDYAGQSSSDKRAEIGRILRKKGLDGAVISPLDSVAWLFNIRGNDVSHTPVTEAYAFVHQDGQADLFINPAKIDDSLRQHLGNQVEIRPYDDFYPYLISLGKKTAGKQILVDNKNNNARILTSLEEGGSLLHMGEDPCLLPKARKNEAEIKGAHEAHVRDGASISDFLAWFAREAPKGQLSEKSAAEQLWQFRSRHKNLKDSSFDSISGSGPNGAIVHYRYSDTTNRAINKDDLYLIDSGAQYPDGTTDITRTLINGTPTADMRRHFTLVLKGHIALSTTRFPRGTSGMALDAIARRPLWEAGLDYDHGTGHGVGSYLAVHEGPQRIAKFGTPIPLETGMILSNEPGYYKTDAYGIRIENLVLVCLQPQPGDERVMMGFKTLTLAPIEKALIDKKLLNTQELDWLNAYHQEVYEKLEDRVLPETRDWLRLACSAL